MFEEYLITGCDEPLQRLITLMHDNVHNYHELALDYSSANLFEEAEQALTIPAVADKLAAASPLTSYYIGYFQLRRGLVSESKESFIKADQTDSHYCFPNRLEDVMILRIALHSIKQGAHAPYYLGCLYYDKRQYDEALKYWTLSAERDPEFPTVWRNLALIYCNKEGDTEKALECMERAFSLDQSDSRIFMELDQLYKRMQKSHEFRLSKFESYPELVAKRDDLILEHATLLNQTGDYERAAEIIDNHIFHPWEGGEGKVPAQYQFSRTERAKAILRTNPTSTNEAISLLTECLAYPHNLGEGKLHGAQENDFHYFLGCAYEQLGDTESARHYWELATHGPQEPAAAMYYNDAKPEKIFYQGMALLKLGRKDEANGRFYRLVNYGKQHIFEKQTMDYFAVSLPDLLIWEDSLDRKNRIHCLFMLALGYTGLGDKAHAERYLKEVEEMDINHQGVQALRTFI